jgi:hypothetical protein
VYLLEYFKNCLAIEIPTGDMSISKRALTLNIAIFFGLNFIAGMISNKQSARFGKVL